MFVLSLERLGMVNRQGALPKALSKVHDLIRHGIVVYQCVEEVRLETGLFPEGHVYPAGTLLIDVDREDLQGPLIDELKQGSFDRTPWRRLRLPQRLGVYNGLNCAEFCSDPYARLFAAFNIPFVFLTDRDIRNGELRNCDLLIVPGGPDAGESYYAGLGESGMQEIVSFVENGGKYFGSCAGSYLPLTAQHGTPVQRMWLNMIGATDVSGLDYWRTGTGFVRVKLEDVRSPSLYGLACGSPSTVDVIYWEGPVFDIYDPRITVLATYQEFLASGSEPPSWSVSGNSCAEDALTWTNPLNRERFDKYMKNRPAAVEVKCGKGRMVLYSFHPEFGSPVLLPWESSLTHLFILNGIYDLMSSDAS